jgi:hypothetical protein
MTAPTPSSARSTSCARACSGVSASPRARPVAWFAKASTKSAGKKPKPTVKKPSPPAGPVGAVGRRAAGRGGTASAPAARERPRPKRGMTVDSDACALHVGQSERPLC